MGLQRNNKKVFLHNAETLKACDIKLWNISCFVKYRYWYHVLWNIDTDIMFCAKWYICMCANMYVRILSSFIWLTKLLWVSRSRMWQYIVMIGLDRMYSGAQECLQWGKYIVNTWFLKYSSTWMLDILWIIMNNKILKCIVLIRLDRQKYFKQK